MSQNAQTQTASSQRIRGAVAVEVNLKDGKVHHTKKNTQGKHGDQYLLTMRGNQ